MTRTQTARWPSSLLVAAAMLSAGAVRAGEEVPPADPAPPLEAAEAPAPEPEPSEPALDPALLRVRVERAMAELEGEPDLAELEREALRLAEADRESVRGWRRAVRLSALLPEVKVTGEYDIERDESLDRYQDEPDRWGADSDRDLGFQASAEWELSELVYNPEEVKVHRELATRADRREALLSLLVGYWFERRGLQIRLALQPPGDVGEMAEILLRIEELTAAIDALTGGLLSRTLEARETPGPPR